MDNEFQDMTFTCKDCGGNKLDVFYKYSTITRFERVDKDDLKVYEGRLIEEWEQFGELDDDHRVTWGASSRFGAEEEIDDWYDIDESELHKYDEEGSYQEAITDEESEEFFVLCWGCRREIEFGWSHPDRGGRIWPVECPDFNPWKSWPEPRYIDSWREKGWLRPGS